MGLQRRGNLRERRDFAHHDNRRAAQAGGVDGRDGPAHALNGDQGDGAQSATDSIATVIAARCSAS